MYKTHNRTLTLADAVEVLNKHRYRGRHWIIDYAGGGDSLEWALGTTAGYDPEGDVVLLELEAIAIAEKLLGSD